MAFVTGILCLVIASGHLFRWGSLDRVIISRLWSKKHFKKPYLKGSYNHEVMVAQHLILIYIYKKSVSQSQKLVTCGTWALLKHSPVYMLAVWLIFVQGVSRFGCFCLHSFTVHLLSCYLYVNLITKAKAIAGLYVCLWLGGGVEGQEGRY